MVMGGRCEPEDAGCAGASLMYIVARVQGWAFHEKVKTISLAVTFELE